MKKSILLFSPKNTAVHDMHMDAIESYSLSSFIVYRSKNFKIFYDLLRIKSKYKNLFIQSTGLLNIFVIIFAKLCSYKIIYYLHEPTSLKRKISENPLIKAIIWHYVQVIDAWFSDKVVVSRKSLIQKAYKNHNLKREKIFIAPLLMPKYNSKVNYKKFRVTYLGRPDNRRYINDFIKFNKIFSNLNIKQTILTGNPSELYKLIPNIPKNIDVYARNNFSESLKSKILDETICLWNPKNGKISQSGVTADAIRFGISLILTDKDPAYNELIDKGIALDFYTSKENNFENILLINENRVKEISKSLFSLSHGKAAFDNYYFDLFNK